MGKKKKKKSEYINTEKTISIFLTTILLELVTMSLKRKRKGKKRRRKKETKRMNNYFSYAPLFCMGRTGQAVIVIV